MPTINKLVLHPLDVDFRPPSWDALIECLIQEQFIGSAIAGRSLAYKVGERFLQSIIFMGCSPAMAFEPAHDGALDFCHVVFSALEQPAVFRYHSQGLIPRCPACGHRVADGVGPLQQYLQGKTAIQVCCASCAASFSPLKLNWRHRGAAARLFIDVYSVYPQEGVPTDQLLAQLQQCSSVPWSYFYTDQ